MTKSGLRGFAGGLILSSSILAIIYFQDPVQGSHTKQGITAVTDQDVEAYLDENNFVTVNQEEYETLVNEKMEAEAQEMAAQSTDENAQAASTDAGQEINKEDRLVVATLEITKGMSTGEVCNFLEEANIIKDSDELLNYLLNNGLEGLVRMGTYKVDSSMSIETIAAEIT